MKRYEFEVYCTDGREYTVYATAESLNQAESNMLKAMLDDGKDPDSWKSWELSGS